MAQLTRKELIKKWAPILEHASCAPITNHYRKEVTAVLLENQERQSYEERGMSPDTLNETSTYSPVNQGGSGIAMGNAGAATGATTVAGYDPILISLVRRSAPMLMAYDVCGVQPLSQPTGLIFAMKSRYVADGSTDDRAEALFNKPNTAFSGARTTESGDAGYKAGGGSKTSTAEGKTPSQMAFSIEKTSVVAKSRMLKAEYSLELAQDLKAVHGLDAESELSNILSTEILGETNREIIDTINTCARAGCQTGTTAAGTFDLDTDSNGRWSVEKFKGLMFQIEREANLIGQQTRRGRGNFIICSSDVASALAMAGVLDYAPAIAANLNVDETATTFAGVLNGRFKVYIDPYAGGADNLAIDGSSQYITVGYKGSSAFDAGVYYCPYTALQMVRAVDPDTFQPKLGFKSRYGVVANPFAAATVATDGLGANTNVYFRRFSVANLM